MSKYQSLGSFFIIGHQVCVYISRKCVYKHEWILSFTFLIYFAVVENVILISFSKTDWCLGYMVWLDVDKICQQLWLQNICDWFLGGAPTSICHFFCLFICSSDCPSVAHHISGTKHVIRIFGTHVQNDDMYRRFFGLLNFNSLDR